MTDSTHISFDLDGTLIDSIPLMRLSWENVNLKLNLGIGWEAYRKNIGLPFHQICKNLSIEEIESEVYELYFKFNQDNINKIKAMNGLQDCVDWLVSHNIDWSIITSKPKSTAIPILNLFDLSPRVLITSDDVQNGKPHIESAQLLISQLNNGINKIYYIGDTIIDHLFSINSKFEFIEFIHKDDDELLKRKYVLNNRSTISHLSDVKNLIS
ncbi:MAG: HAD family hydrolase [Candidatus Brocadiales bacterium]|nr:HAD family hydrolase [Candidatus Brocadiales bacterium]